MTIHFILYLFIVVMLLVTGLRAVAGRGLALTLSSSSNGPLLGPLACCLLFLRSAWSFGLSLIQGCQLHCSAKASDPW
ncbi:hypothetical protein [Thermomonas carbonis]|uniref:Uncharacterized protein n=1 Tax=Thermomonas carbonis TaxID=1463158 RepID=A0A7G9SNE5_9GAMM|nr:hypothetical protein [Thermomonas carbonis]QNN69370.1 hypothetical protein H9L16_11890 [Thermomonas carbonis]